MVYHGEESWKAARSLAELIPSPEAFQAYQVGFGFPLLDLSGLSDAEITGTPILQSILRLLMYSRSGGMNEKLRQILELLKSSGLNSDDLRVWVEVIGVYVMSVNKEMDGEKVDFLISSVFPTSYEPGSIIDRAVQKGMEKGIEKGIEKGALLGTIQTCQSILGLIVDSETELMDLSLLELSQKASELQAQLRNRVKK